MKFIANAKILSVDDEHTANIKRKTKDLQMDVATFILDCGDGMPICAKCFGRDKIAVVKEKLVAGTRDDYVLSIYGVVKQGEKRTFYSNEVILKWVL